MSLEGQDNVVRTQILGPRDWSSQFSLPVCHLLELKEDNFSGSQFLPQSMGMVRRVLNLQGHFEDWMN